MLNPEINEFSVTEDLTQVASYFNIVDNLVRTGDTNKKYVITTHQCEGAPAPFDLGSWTTIPLSAQGENMVDLYNSFLTVDLNLGSITPTTGKDPFPSITGTAPTGVTTNKPGLWFGFKDSANIVGQYQLVANGQTFYTQSFAIEESYITSLATTEAVKHVDAYSKAIHEDVWSAKKMSKAGVIINADTKDNTSNLITLKIDFRRFLPLATIKYLPEFIGNLQMRIKFSIDGLVVAPLGPEYILKGNKYVDADVVMSGGITNKFVPYKCLENGDTIYGITSAAWASETGTTTISSTDHTTTLNKKKLTLTAGLIGAKITATPKIEMCKSHLACFGLHPDVYNQLAARYLDPNPALSFPIQTMSFHPMNGHFGDVNGNVQPSLTAVPRYIDSIFVLFPLNSDYHTCFDNVMANSYQLKMGGFGSFPEVQYNTWSPEFVEVSSNVFNVNNDLTGFSPDVVNSLLDGPDTHGTVGYFSNDTTNFVLGIPTSTDNTFQQGQTSNTTINYQLQMKLNSNSPFKAKQTCTPMLCFLKDSVLAIQLKRDGHPPIVTLDEYDIASPA